MLQGWVSSQEYVTVVSADQQAWDGNKTHLSTPPLSHALLSSIFLLKLHVLPLSNSERIIKKPELINNWTARIM